jgi:hypothetical protein
MNASEFFSRDYFEARTKFRLAASHRGAELRTLGHPSARGPFGEELFIDVAILGEPCERVLLAVAGTHGVEGYAGSAVLTGWLRADPSSTREVRQVLVHALNPYGFAWDRRVTEENVDLNRNFIDWTVEPPGNDDYAQLADAIAPPDLGDSTLEAASRALRNYAREHGAFAMQETISKGQYTHPSGMYFGGTREQWSAAMLRAIVNDCALPCRQAAILDFHTGLGPFGEVELISEDPPDSLSFARARAWFSDRVSSTRSGSSISAQVFGSLDSAIPMLFGEAETTAVCVEYGTQSTLEVFQALRADNWVHTVAEPHHPDRDAIREQMRQAFYPETDVWKNRVWRQGRAVLEQALMGLCQA